MKLSLKKLLLVTLCISFSVISEVQAQPDIQVLEKNMEQRLKESDILGISVAYIYSDGRTQFISRGSLSTEREQSVDKNTIYEIGSITKTFTALILARMVQQNKIALNDPIGTFLPDSIHTPTYQGQKITLLDLATHTSGLPRIPSNLMPENKLNPYADYTVRKLYAFLNSYHLTKTPGSSYQYSNLGVGLLGHILTRVSGKTYPQLLHEYITGPLEMNETEIAVPNTEKGRFAMPYNYGKPVEHWDFDALEGAGAVRSTAADMATYIKAQLGLRESHFETAITETQQPHFEVGRGNIGTIGLAWIQSTQQDTIIWHNGETGGFRSFIGFNKEKRTGVVVLASGRDNIDDIGMHLLDKRNPLRHVNHRISVDSTLLKRYTGTYKISPAFSVTITQNGDQMTEKATGQQPLRIYPESETKFFLKAVDAEIEFIPNKEGDFTILKLYQNGRVQEGERINQN